MISRYFKSNLYEKYKKQKKNCNKKWNKMKIIFSWSSSAIRFFLKKKKNKIRSWAIDAIAHNELGPWCFLQKMAQIKSGMVTGCMIKRLMIYLGKSGKTGKKWDSRIETPTVCMEWANFSTQAAVNSISWYSKVA